MPANAKAERILEHPTHNLEQLEPAPLVFYPAYCFRASPTWFTWVKLTAFDIHHRLQIQPDFHTAPKYIEHNNGWTQSQTLLLFYLNHPIQFVQLVGVVVAFDEFFERVWVFTVDDSSGATIEVSCRKPDKVIVGEVEKETPREKPDAKTKADTEARLNVMSKLDIGSVVQVKGQITTFRDTRQLQLDRITLIADTNQEMQYVAARTHIYCTILSVPWNLSPAMQKSLQQQEFSEDDAQRDAARRRQKLLQLHVEREKRHTEKVSRQYRKEEARRKDRAEDARRAAHALTSVRP